MNFKDFMLETHGTPIIYDIKDIDENKFYEPTIIVGGRKEERTSNNQNGDIDDNKKLIWDCSKCTWIHKKSTVDKIFKEINKNFYSIKTSKK